MRIPDLSAITNAQRQRIVNELLSIRARARELNRIANDAIEAMHLMSPDAEQQLQAVADECNRQWEAAQAIAETLKADDNAEELAELQQGKNSAF